MKTSLARLLILATAFLSATGVASAHPGHDGHELTWDLRHLAQHPIATIGCAAVIGAAITIIIQALRRRTDDRAQSLRASQRSRGK
jgi:hypothetical protein